MSVDAIRHEIQGSLSGRVEEICLELLHRLSTRPVDQSERLSFNTFAAWVDLKPSNHNLHSALTALCHIKSHPIEPYFIFLDLREDREVELSVDYVKQALAVGSFINPQTGYALENFADFIVPMFRITNEFRGVISESR